ncbi:hypothetical protein B7494_g7190 [Chlorociboria aeruginascens]|nr:hypothetical protein B7494_g7190 [Chlorociboria aeruginascens]
MHRELIDLATTLQRFIETKHPFATTVTGPTCQQIAIFAAASSYQQPASRSTRGSTATPPAPSFPIEWTQSSRSFAAAVRTFLTHLERFHAEGSEKSSTSSAPQVSQTTSRRTKPLPKAQDIQVVPGSFDDSTTSPHSAVPTQVRTSTEKTPTSTPNMSREDNTPLGSQAPPPMQINAELRAEIAAVVAATLDERDARRQRDSTAGTEPPRLRTLSPSTAPGDNHASLRTDDIGFFNPDMSDADLSESSSSKIIYNDVYAFTDRLLHLSAAYDEQKIRNLLPTCLRGSALTWHSIELTSIERQFFARVTLPEVCDGLIKRFKEAASVAVNEYMKAELRIDDIVSGQSMRGYAQKMFKHARAAGMTGTYNQLIAVWNSLDPEMRLHIAMPTTDTSMSAFLQTLDEKEQLFRDRVMSERGPTHSRQGRYPSQGIPERRFDRYGHNRNNAFHRGYTDQTSNQRNRQYPTYPGVANPNQRQYQTSPRTQQNAWVQNSRPTQNPFPPRHQGYTDNRGGNTGNRGNQFQNAGPSMRTLPSNPARLQITAPNGFASHDKPWRSQNAYASAAFADANDSLDLPLEHNEQDTANANNAQGDLDEHYDAYEDPYDYEPVANFSQPSPSDFACKKCDEVFPSKNKLHIHLRRHDCQRIQPVEDNTPSTDVVVNLASDAPVIKSTAKSNLDCGTGYGFRKWHYVTAQAKLHLDMDPVAICIDTGCSLSLIDEAWLLKCIPDVKIRTMATPIMVRGISNLKHPTSKYVIIPFYLQGNDSYACITREIHLVNDLQAKMLIGVDILAPEGIDICISTRTATISHCGNLEVPLQVMQHGPRVQRAVLAQKALTVPPRSHAVIPIHHIALPERNFLFEPADTGLTMYAHLVNHEMSGVVAQNDSDVPVQIQRNLRLGLVGEFDFDSFFVCSPDDDQHHDMEALAKKFPGPSRTFKVTGDKSKETVLPNGATVHGTDVQVAAYTSLLAEFADMFNDSQCVDLPEEEWMKIELKHNWQEILKNTKAKVYPVGLQDRKTIDAVHDKLHEQGRMVYTTDNSPFSFPIFVVHKALASGTDVGRAVADIRDLNLAAIPDTYPLPLQSEIIAMCRGCPFISAIDATSFFFQWRVHPESRKYLTVVSHRGQETFNVAIMGFRNSPAYCQRKMDSFFRGLTFAKAYIDDIIVASRTFEAHLEHLRTIFGILLHRHITVKAKKLFLGFPSALVLGQKVTALGLSTTEERLEAIRRLTFPQTLKHLETYLGMTGYLRQFIKDYAIISKPLEDRKTLLLKLAPSKGKPRQNYSRRALYRNPTTAELNSFRALQKSLASSKNLVHCDPNRQLFADIDASKDGIGVMIYHVKDNSDPLSTAYLDPNDDGDSGTTSTPSESTLSNPSAEMPVPHVLTPSARTFDNHDVNPTRSAYPRKKDIEPVMFLSRKLNGAEARYWPTELEMAAVVWTARKIKHLIETMQRKPVIFYVDHGPLLGATQRSSIVKTSSISRLNLKLVRASEFLSTLPLEIFYKPGKAHFVPDALSRLPGRFSSPSPTNEEEGELDALFICPTSDDIVPVPTATAYTVTAALVAMDSSLKQRIIEGYLHDPKWSKIREVLHYEGQASEPAILPFELHDSLIYKKAQDGNPRRLCIPSSCIKSILTEAHDQNSHSGFIKLQDTVSKSFFIRGITKHLKQFIAHCPECQIFQTAKHSTYGSMQPILSPPVPFHTITIDFILALPIASDYNSVMSVTCKFSKRVALVAGHSEWTAAQWASALTFRLIDLDWGLPKVIISDRGPQFLSQLWQSVFDALGTKLSFSTAYHPQTDGQSERTNQTVELALRFLFHTLDDVTHWPEYLPLLQHHFNNSPSASTGRTPNEVVMGFTPNDVIHLLSPDTNSILTRTLHTPHARVDVSDSIADAAVMMKFYYDKKHKSISMKVGDKAFIKLHKGYTIPSATSKKLHQQRVGPFTIIEKIGQLAYKLDIPQHWRVHNVFSIAQLEPCIAGTDPYDRKRPEHPGPVFVEGDDEFNKSFELDKILAKRKTPTGQTRYLVRWKGYGPEYDQWYSEKRLANAKDLIEEYETMMK